MSRVMCIGDPNKQPGYQPGQWSILPVIGEYYTIGRFFKKGEPFILGTAIGDSYCLREMPQCLYPVNCFATLEEDENTIENEYTELVPVALPL